MERRKRGLSTLLLAAVALVATLVVAPAASAWTVTMDANPSFKRTYDWDIKKSATPTSVKVKPGGTAEVTYKVTVESTGYTDSDWAVSGNVHMTAGDDQITVATLGVTIQEDNLAATVDCVPPLPINLGDSPLDCGYSASLSDASARTADMRATTADGGARFVRTPFDFTNATVTEVDECVAVTDTTGGNLGTVCVGDAPKTFTYTERLGPYMKCGSKTVDNTATFRTNDTGTTGSASAAVAVEVKCDKPDDDCKKKDKDFDWEDWWKHWFGKDKDDDKGKDRDRCHDDDDDCDKGKSWFGDRDRCDDDDDCKKDKSKSGWGDRGDDDCKDRDRDHDDDDDDDRKGDRDHDDDDDDDRKGDKDGDRRHWDD
ncbi:MAG: hypothetical protein ACRDNI_06500 [Gaiellaceae bacterium]